jgi:hypothetical protein
MAAWPARAGAGLGALALAAGIAGCGGGAGGTSATESRPPAASGLFVGRAGDGLGASVDFGGFDRVTRALRPALGSGPGAPAIGVASVVNGSNGLRPVPTFSGVRADGGQVAMPSAWRALSRRDDTAARRARALLAPLAPIPPDGSVAVYLVLPGGRPSELAAVRMLTGSGERVDLGPRSR